MMFGFTINIRNTEAMFQSTLESSTMTQSSILSTSVSCQQTLRILAASYQCNKHQLIRVQQ
uniref:Uncharacterized protein n=1 Tax=Arion vulgaris TaxID=1028688 RepID=A0A0B7AD30_9EUPU